MAMTSLRRTGWCLSLSAVCFLAGCTPTPDPPPDPLQESAPVYGAPSPAPIEQGQDSPPPSGPYASSPVQAQPVPPADGGAAGERYEPPADLQPNPGEDPLVGTASGDVTGGGGDVSGGGPIGVDEAALARLVSQMPTASDDHVYEGQQALRFARWLPLAFPQTTVPVKVISPLATCMGNYGVVGVRGYLAHDYSAAAVVTVASHNQLQRLGDVVSSCVNDATGGGPVTGGGPGGPCYRQHYYDASTVDGVTDRYYVMMAATHENVCTFLQNQHNQYGPMPF